MSKKNNKKRDLLKDVQSQIFELEKRLKSLDVWIPPLEEKQIEPKNEQHKKQQSLMNEAKNNQKEKQQRHIERSNGHGNSASFRKSVKRQQTDLLLRYKQHLLNLLIANDPEFNAKEELSSNEESGDDENDLEEFD